MGEEQMGRNKMTTTADDGRGTDLVVASLAMLALFIEIGRAHV